MKPETKAAIFFLTVLVLLSAITIASFIQSVENEKNERDSMGEGCPGDNFTCPDGTVAHRMLPYCEFEPCP
ncbi:MAG: hypothetical protein GF416_03545 [Candidatus Altiarchaeales archaeon]|nr:hypothetical protein [Candidatus Altiarchaeales archaeon]MBD3416193.1 hypothetical protein [Candidatus Altiarchaeales archaeon]